MLQQPKRRRGCPRCYSVAFSLLALANAHRAGLPGMAAHIEVQAANFGAALRIR